MVPNPETPLWRKLIRYIPYILKHKWYVFIECVRLGIPLRGLLHDIDKLLPDELIPYAHRFGGPQGIKYGRDKTGHYSSTTGDEKFDRALGLHIVRNWHHWQSWTILRVDDGKVEVRALEMDNWAWKEMVADWRGASRAQGGNGDVREWYEKNRGKLILHPTTRANCEAEIGYKEV